MSTVLKRTLTRKSILGFGYESHRDLSVQQMLDLGNAKYLISAYYFLEKINFTDDILDELGITEDIRIPKPSKVGYDSELVKRAKDNYYSGLSDIQRMGYYNRGRRIYKAKNAVAISGFVESKSSLTRKNHGK